MVGINGQAQDNLCRHRNYLHPAMASRFYHHLHSFGVLLRTAAAMHLLQTCVFEFAVTGGLSMLPTLRALGDHVFVDKLNHRYGKDIAVGDVVVMLKPTDEHTRVCKRVAGLPGDIVYANPTPTYVPAQDASIPAPRDLLESAETTTVRTGKYVRVPEGCIWVLGDNSAASLDSRDYGPVPKGLVVGKVRFAVFWGPFELFPSAPRRIASNDSLSASPDVCARLAAEDAQG
ncbi:peptidase S24/S26A/S26B/S26C [Limtongia smithiae]|uniref:peptidase S24/S26A/S26B/S26C n=1 Tax=Limtongia smithiae TaxID=1125753 RepID=UPI0034CD0F88